MGVFICGCFLMCVLVFTVFCIVCTVFFVLFRLCTGYTQMNGAVLKVNLKKLT